MHERSVRLFDAWDNGGSRLLTATVREAGDLRLVQLHGGPAVSQAWGTSVGWSEYNIGVDVEEVPKLVAMLGGSPGDDVLGLLEARYRDGTYAEDTVHPLMQAMDAASVTCSHLAWLN
jgi:hypothetical protein